MMMMMMMMMILEGNMSILQSIWTFSTKSGKDMPRIGAETQGGRKASDDLATKLEFKAKWILDFDLSTNSLCGKTTMRRLFAASQEVST